MPDPTTDEQEWTDKERKDIERQARDQDWTIGRREEILGRVGEASASCRCRAKDCPICNR